MLCKDEAQALGNMQWTPYWGQKRLNLSFGIEKEMKQKVFRNDGLCRRTQPEPSNP